MTEPSAEEIVAKAEQGWALGNGDTLRLIASWRERGEALRAAWVVEDRNEGVCVVVTDSEGVPFRSRTNYATGPLWLKWEAKRRAALGLSSSTDSV